MKYVALTGMDSTQSIDLVASLGALKALDDMHGGGPDTPTMHWNENPDGSFHPVLGVPDDWDLVKMLRSYAVNSPVKDLLLTWRYKLGKASEEDAFEEEDSEEESSEGSVKNYAGWTEEASEYEETLTSAIRRQDLAQERFIRSLAIETAARSKEKKHDRTRRIRRSLLFLPAGNTLGQNILYNIAVKYVLDPKYDWIHDALFIGTRSWKFWEEPSKKSSKGKTKDPAKKSRKKKTATGGKPPGDRLYLDDRSSNVRAAFSDGEFQSKVKIGAEWLALIALGSIPTFLNRNQQVQTMGFEKSPTSKEWVYALATWSPPTTWTQIQRILTSRLLRMESSERCALGITRVYEMRVDRGTLKIPGHLGCPSAR